MSECLQFPKREGPGRYLTSVTDKVKRDRSLTPPAEETLPAKKKNRKGKAERARKKLLDLVRL